MITKRGEEAEGQSEAGGVWGKENSALPMDLVTIYWNDGEEKRSRGERHTSNAAYFGSA